MKTSNRILAISAAVLTLSLGGLALAQAGQGNHGHMGSGMGSGMGSNMGMQHGKQQGMGQHGGAMRGAGEHADAATRLADAKTELKISAAQEPAWQAFETVVRQQVDARQALRAGMQKRMQDPAAAATIDRTAQRETMQKYRESEQSARDQARQALYAVLTPEQRAVADQRLAAGPGHRKGGHRHAS